MLFSVPDVNYDSAFSLIGVSVLLLIFCSSLLSLLVLLSASLSISKSAIGSFSNSFFSQV